MKKQYINLLKLKNQYYGIAQGFNVLDRILNNLESLNNDSSENIINVYDYRTNKYINIKCDHLKFEIMIQKVYQEYLLKEYFIKFEWYNKMVSSTREIFFLDNEVVFYSLIKYIMRAFLHLANHKNEYSFNIFIKHVSLDLDKLEFYKLYNSKSSEKFVKTLTKKLIHEGLIKKPIMFDTMNLTDEYFNHIMIVTSAGMPRLYSELSGYQIIKYSCSYALEQLPLIIDYYNLDLEKILFYLPFKHNTGIFYPKTKKYFDDYYNFNFLEIQLLNIPQDIKNTLIYLEKRKTFLNEYCFHVIVMSFVSNYVYTPNSKHILFSFNIKP